MTYKPDNSFTLKYSFGLANQLTSLTSLCVTCRIRVIRYSTWLNIYDNVGRIKHGKLGLKARGTEITDEA
jgi:hypothetical protein